MEFIKNKKELGITRMRERALSLLEAGLFAIDPFSLMKKSLLYSEKFNCLTVQNTEFNIISGRIFVVGGGKAAGRMAEALEDVIGEKNITAGFVNALEKNSKLKKIKVTKAGHPLPDKNGVLGVEKMLALKEEYDINKKDLVVVLLSGGGSALLPAPVSGISLDDKQKTTDILIKSGANIREINTVRKHLSRIKGGRLAEYFAPAKVVSLIISDVLDNDPQTIASGPGVIDKTVYHDAYAVLEKYQLIQKVPATVEKYLRKCAQENVRDTPKKLPNASSFIIGSNLELLDAMTLIAKKQKMKPLVITSRMCRDVLTEAKELATDIIAGKYKDYDVLLFAGETLINVLGKSGKGGRNQHFSALFMPYLKNFEKEWVLASISTDGRDYIAGVGGAIIDNNSLHQAQSANLAYEKYLNDFDAYNLLKKLKNSLIKTDNTGTNVGDAGVIILK